MLGKLFKTMQGKMDILSFEKSEATVLVYNFMKILGSVM